MLGRAEGEPLVVQREEPAEGDDEDDDADVLLVCRGAAGALADVVHVSPGLPHLALPPQTGKAEFLMLGSGPADQLSGWW